MIIHNTNTVKTVQHDYHDHGKDPILLQQECSATSSIVSPQRGASKQFPFKLYEMLLACTAETDAETDESVVGWQPHGRCFMVRDSKRFVEDVLPR